MSLCDTGHPDASQPMPEAPHIYLAHSLSLSPAVVGNLLVSGLDLGNDAIQVQEAAVVHGQHHGHVRDLSLQITNLLFIQLPAEVDLISQPFQEGLQLYFVHASFIHVPSMRTNSSSVCLLSSSSYLFFKSSTSPSMLPNSASSPSFSWASVSSCH
ncbi:hypothetical protein HJG60_008583 [Phyllostomus discolor]|uniref:Uncharacterized protein n=1 Tax=Phyllostomus discolor TaxID=89673 RepID=A0A834DNJ3_9CHIR|nr:hypothetical protein HJG60_008583 [Phyllostomus discolor]